MTDFYGKSYRYKDKVIGVIPALNDEKFMIGCIKPSGSLNRVRFIDELARLRELCEAVSEVES